MPLELIVALSIASATALLNTLIAILMIRRMRIQTRNTRKTLACAKLLNTALRQQIARADEQVKAMAADLQEIFNKVNDLTVELRTSNAVTDKKLDALVASGERTAQAVTLALRKTT